MRPQTEPVRLRRTVTAESAMSAMASIYGRSSYGSFTESDFAYLNTYAICNCRDSDTCNSRVTTLFTASNKSPASTGRSEEIQKQQGAVPLILSRLHRIKAFPSCRESEASCPSIRSAYPCGNRILCVPGHISHHRRPW